MILIRAIIGSKVTLVCFWLGDTPRESLTPYSVKQTHDFIKTGFR